MRRTTFTRDHLTRDQGLVYDFLLRHGGGNDHNTYYAYLRLVGPMSPSGFRTRRSELASMDLVRYSGKVTNPVSGNRQVRSWEPVVVAV